MDGRTALASPVDLRDELAPGGEGAAERPLRELEQQRGDRLVHLFKARQGEWFVPRAGRHAEEPVEMLIAALLVGLHVARGMEDDAAALPPIGMHTDRRLLGHRPGREEQRRLLAEQCGDLLLELA